VKLLGKLKLYVYVLLGYHLYSPINMGEENGTRVGQQSKSSTQYILALFFRAHPFSEDTWDSHEMSIGNEILN
jgi:hypothetical protein